MVKIAMIYRCCVIEMNLQFIKRKQVCEVSALILYFNSRIAKCPQKPVDTYMFTDLQGHVLRVLPIKPKY